MKTFDLIAILASTADGVIGNSGKLPWHIPSDLKRFKRLTTDHTLIMGRKTYDSIGRPLPKRKTIVITRDPHFAQAHDSLFIAKTPEQAVEIAKQLGPLAFVAGGAQIYRLLVPKCTQVLWTRVSGEIAGDAIYRIPDDRFKSFHKNLQPRTHREAGDSHSYQLITLVNSDPQPIEES